MPEYIVTDPSGNKFRVNGPEGASEQDALKYVQSQQNPQAEGLAGVGAAAATGLGKIPGAVLGFPAALQDLAAPAAQAAGLPPKMAGNQLPRSGDIDKAVEGVTGPFHKAGNPLEKVVEGAVTSLPSAIGGPAGVAGRVGSALVGGAASELVGQGIQSAGGSPGTEAAGRMATSILAPTGARKIITPHTATSPKRLEDAALLEQLSKDSAIPQLRPTAGEKTGSPLLLGREGRLMPKRAEESQKGLNALNSSKTGNQVEEFTTTPGSGFFAKAAGDIGSKIEEVGKNNTLDANKATGLQNGLANIEAKFSQPLYEGITKDVKGAISHTLNVLSDNGGVVSGKDYQRLRSELGKEAASADGNKAYALRQIVHELDNAMEHSIQLNNPKDLGKFREARSQWHALQALEEAALGKDFAKGDITAGSMVSGAKKAYGRDPVLQGKDPFSESNLAAQNVFDRSGAKNPDGTEHAHAIGTALGAVGSIAAHKMGMPGLPEALPFIGYGTSGYTGPAISRLFKAPMDAYATSKFGQGHLGNQFMPLHPEEKGQRALGHTIRALIEPSKTKKDEK